MDENYWGKYTSDQPKTHFDPLQSFMVDEKPIGFRVNFVPGRINRPREQHIKVESEIDDNQLDRNEIENSPLYKVYKGIEAGIVIAADDKVMNDPYSDPVTKDYTGYNGLTVMNKFSPLGVNSEQAKGFAMVSYPSTYTRKLNNWKINLDLLIPMKSSLKFLIESEDFREFKTPLIFFNIGPASGASIRYLHGQSYVVPQSYGLNSYGYRMAFEQNEKCLTCDIGNNEIITDHLGQTINYKELTIWEDENIRLIYPYAPLRTLQTRIIPKKHVDYFGNSDSNMMISLAKALTIADHVMNETLGNRRKTIRDRTISFRQTSEYGKDYHLFIDIYPPFPFVASETVDFLGLSPFLPTEVAEWMRSVDITDLT